MFGHHTKTTMSGRGTNSAGQELHRYLSYAKANNDEFEIFIRLAFYSRNFFQAHGPGSPGT